MIVPVGRCDEVALLQAPSGVAHRGFGAAEAALGGGDHLGPGGQALHGQFRLELHHFGPRRVAVGERGIEDGLRHDAAFGQRRLAGGLALGLAQADPGVFQRGLGDGDLLGAAAFAQVGELGLGLVAGRLRLGKRDLRVGALLLGDNLAGGHALALARPDPREGGRGHRREVDVLALDIAHRQEFGRGAGEEACDQRQGAQEAGHRASFRSASRRAMRLRAMVSATAPASAAPMVGQSIRRCTTGRPMWK